MNQFVMELEVLVYLQEQKEIETMSKWFEDMNPFSFLNSKLSAGEIILFRQLLILQSDYM